MIRQFVRTTDLVLVIEETKEGFFFYSFPKVGMEGDTWHQTLTDAKDQARFQFGMDEWADIPSTVTDLRAFARQ